MLPSFYHALGLTSVKATLQEIKMAYRRVAKLSHPDKVQASQKAQATERMKQINEAYEVLSDSKNG